VEDHDDMIILELTRHNGIRVAELGLALAAVAGIAFVFSAIAPLGRKPGTLLGGIALAAGAVLVLVAVHWGKFG
jgi:hypothetical protein